MAVKLREMPSEMNGDVHCEHVESLLPSPYPPLRESLLPNFVFLSA